MKRIIISVFVAFFMAICGISFADILPIPISAEQAFDAVQTQTDPVTGLDTRVALVDVRTRAEYYWVGAACQVDEIETTNGEIISPDYGKVILTLNGRFLSYEINGHNKRLQVKKVSKMNLLPISLNIPFEFWNENPEEGEKEVYRNKNFATEIERLADEYDVIIFLCRSGARSQSCLSIFDTGLFDAIYEIDQPDGISGNGGFEGNSYSNVYNGYRGFPERLTEIQEHPSVSWKDAGLPMKTGLK